MKNVRAALASLRSPIAPSGRLRGVVSLTAPLATCLGAVVLLATSLLVTALFAASADAAPANTAGNFVFVGRGNGHGVGMSQWGAWEGAREGNSYAQILAFYYPGTTLSTLQDAAAGQTVKVRISSKPWTSNTAVYSEVEVRPTVTDAELRVYKSPTLYSSVDVPLGSVVLASGSGRKVAASLDGVDLGSFEQVELVPGAGDAAAAGSEGRVEIGLTTGRGTVIEPREYWGTIRVQPGDDPSDLWVYNLVPLEKYVRSIAEVDYDWATPGGDYYAPEAVKAQAVAARTYAVAKKGATMTDSWADQCYRGYTFEAKYPGIADAAEATAGRILTYEGQAITANFSGHSGGYTTNSAWSGTQPPYLVCQPDPWSLKAPPAGVGKGPGWSWTYTISTESLSDKVNGDLRDVSGKKVDVGTLTDVAIVARDTADPTSHATRLLLKGSEGSAQVSVLSFRSLIGSSNLPSTLILTVNGESGPGGGSADDGATAGGDNGGEHGGIDNDQGGTDNGNSGGSGGGSLAPGEFYDVGPTHLYHDQISRVVTEQLMGGYENGLFKPLGTVSRAQFAKIAVNLYNLMHPAGQIAVANVTTRPFEDVAVNSKVNGDSSDWIAAAKNAGLVLGVTSSTFMPYAEIQREQMASMMCRALGWDDEADALSPDTPGFSDLALSSPHWAAATYLKQLGILLGYGETGDAASAMLGVGEPIKRQHVAVILCRVLDSKD
jgi:stage II sporulation protein D